MSKYTLNLVTITNFNWEKKNRKTRTEDLPGKFKLSAGSAKYKKGSGQKEQTRTDDWGNTNTPKWPYIASAIIYSRDIYCIMVLSREGNFSLLEAYFFSLSEKLLCTKISVFLCKKLWIYNHVNGCCLMTPWE